MSSTIFDYLSPHGLSASACRSHYSSFLSLASRLVGASLTDFASIAYLSPLTAALYTGIFRPCLRVPACDLRSASLSPRQRRLVLLESSVAHGCPFCTAHVANMGDALNGPLVAQCTRAGRVVGAGVEEGDHEITTLINEVCAFPAVVKEETRNAFEKRFGSEGYRELAGMTAYMGWLNFIMDAIDIPLERGLAPFAQLALAPRELPFDVMDALPKQESDSFGEEKAQLVTSGKGAKPLRRFGSQVRNVAALVGLTPSVANALSVERQQFKGIPQKVPQLVEWRQKEFGCALKFDQEMEDAEVKRALSYAVREVFFRDETSTWTRSEKFALLYVFGKGAANPIIVEDAVALATAQRVKEDTPSDGKGVSSEAVATEVRQKLENICTAASSEKASTAFSGAAKFIYSAAGPAKGVQKAGTVEVILTYVETPESVMDVLGMLGMFALMHRMAVLCGGK